MRRTVRLPPGALEEYFERHSIPAIMEWLTAELATNAPGGATPAAKPEDLLGEPLRVPDDSEKWGHCLLFVDHATRLRHLARRIDQEWEQSDGEFLECSEDEW